MILSVLSKIKDGLTKEKIKKYTSSVLSLPQGFTITCHSGAYGTPENSVESIETCVKNNAQIVEMDITFRPDGTPCVIHSSNPGMNEGEDFKKMLSAVAASDTCRMNLDLKNYSNLPEIDRILKEMNLFDRAFYTGVNLNVCNTVKENSGVPYYINTVIPPKKRRSVSYIESLCREYKERGALGINCHYSNLNKTVCDIFHKNGLLVSAWTADSKLSQTMLLSLGVDNITTRKPADLKELIDNWKK